MRNKPPEGCKRLWMLKPSKKLCNDFFVFDVETGIRKKDGIHWCLEGTPERFIFGVLKGYNSTKVFYSVEEFKKEFLKPEYKNKKIFAHNAQYDLNTIYGNIYLLDKEAIFNGKFISATNGNCYFADSSNIFVGASVEKIGEMIGKKKESLGNDSYISKEVTAKDVNYCIRDCEIIFDALQSVFEFAGKIRITQASLSMEYFRRYHQRYNIDYNENTKFFWLSYFGGRTEYFKVGKTYASVIDINSSYPYNMKNTTFPNPRNLRVEHNLSLKKFNSILKHYEGCAHLEIFHPDNIFGFLPVKKDGKLLFPVGNLCGWWNFNELRFAITEGKVKVKKVLAVCYSEPLDSPFISFVDVLNKMKTDAKISGNAFEEDRAKRFANSLYGKFAQRIEEESIYIDNFEKQIDIIREYQKENRLLKIVPFNAERKDCFIVVKTDKKFSVPYSIPSFASYITSAARVLLLKKMLEMKECKIVYCDTDSIFFEINKGFVSSNDLGGWKLENKIVTEIRGLKNYKFIEPKTGKEIWRVKGVPVDKGKTLKIFSTDGEKEVKTVTQTGENSFEYYNLVKSKEALKRGLTPGVLIKRVKTIKQTLDKRIVQTNGETKPIKLI